MTAYQFVSPQCTLVQASYYVYLTGSDHCPIHILCASNLRSIDSLVMLNPMLTDQPLPSFCYLQYGKKQKLGKGSGHRVPHSSIL